MESAPRENFEAKRERTTPTTRFDFFTDSLFFFCVSRRFVCLLWPKSSTSSFQLRRYFEQPKKKEDFHVFIYFLSFTYAIFSVHFFVSFAQFSKRTFFFFSQDHMTHDQMLVCDLVGIFAMIFGSFLSACHLSFYCEDVLRVFYQSMVTIMCVIGVVLVRSYFMSAFAHHLVRLCK